MDNIVPPFDFHKKDKYHPSIIVSPLPILFIKIFFHANQESTIKPNNGISEKVFFDMRVFTE